MLPLTLMMLCTVPVLATSLAQGLWPRPTFYYNRVSPLSPPLYASPATFNPTYLPPSIPSSKPDCIKGKIHNDVTFQAGTTNFGTISQVVQPLPTQASTKNQNSFALPITTNFQPSNTYPFSNNNNYQPQAQAQTQSQVSALNNLVQNTFNQPEQFTVTPEVIHHSTASSNTKTQNRVNTHNNNQNRNDYFYNNNNNNNNNNNHNKNNQNRFINNNYNPNNGNQNKGNQNNQNQNQNQISNGLVHNNVNITTSNVFEIPGMEQFKNCVPIPGSDGACVILQDDTKSSEHSAEATPPKPTQHSNSKASKELIYAPPKAPQPQLNFKSIDGLQNQNGNYFSYNVDTPNRGQNSHSNGNRMNNHRFNNAPISSFARGNTGLDQENPFNLRNQFLNIQNNHNNNNNNPRPGTRMRNNNNNQNQFQGQNSAVRGISAEALPSPQAFQSHPVGHAYNVDSDKHSEGSEKVPGEKVEPPFENLPESKEFYMRFLRLWSIYHKRYGCSFKPTAADVSSSNYKRSVKKAS